MLRDVGGVEVRNLKLKSGNISEQCLSAFHAARQGERTEASGYPHLEIQIQIFQTEDEATDYFLTASMDSQHLWRGFALDSSSEHLYPVLL